HNVPALNVTDAAGLQPGMIVGLLTYQGTWWIIGRVARPGTRDFGDIVLRDDDGSMLRLKNSSIEMVPAPGIENVYGKISSFNIGGRLWIQLDPPQSEEPQDNKVVVEGASVGTDGAVWVAGAGYVEVRSSQGNVALTAEAGRIYAQAGGGTRLEMRSNRDIMLWGRELWTLGTGNVIHSNSAEILFQPSGNIQSGATGGSVFHK